MSDVHERPSAESSFETARRIVSALSAEGVPVDVVVNDSSQFISVRDAIGGIKFIEVDCDEMRIVPMVTVGRSTAELPFTAKARGSWVDSQLELTVDLYSVTSAEAEAAVLSFARDALAYWTERSTPKAGGDTLNEVPLDDPQHAQVSSAPPMEDDATEPEARHSPARIAADITHQWSWASSSARIPQITALTLELGEPVENARLSITVHDGDIQFGSRVIHDGPLAGGLHLVGSAHVPLSSQVMAQIEERRGAECSVVLEDLGSGRVLARLTEAIDIQPRDLWLWGGDPRRNEQKMRLEAYALELEESISRAIDESELLALQSELERLQRLQMTSDFVTHQLSNSLLASFVRPNHPEVAAIAREAAQHLQTSTGDSSFYAYQVGDVEKAVQRADASVDAIYEALRARSIAYSEPPPGWDYEKQGQRIRDHGSVAQGGLATCMDSTVLMAAVIEQVGLQPVLVLVPGHIFVGYWRQNPGDTTKAEWYPDQPLVSNPETVQQLVQGGWLGLIETTAFATGKNLSPAQARHEALSIGLRMGLENDNVRLIDIAAARSAGVSPLPAVTLRPDGVTEVVEYRPGGGTEYIEVLADLSEDGQRERRVDDHPPRYRTWKASLFALNATNSLLNLGNNARVQPLALPATALGLVEDKLNQDVTFTIRSGYDIPTVWQARDIANAMEIMYSGEAQDREELVQQARDRILYVQRIARSKGEMRPVGPTVFFREMRTMANSAKTARDERGMNPLFLCLGVLQWPYKDGAMAEAPLILVPVNLTPVRGRHEFNLTLDATQQTTTNAALIEWLRREHDLTIPGLVEPLTDRAGIDVDAVLAEVRQAIADRGLALSVSAKACLATLDLSAFRMWQDLNNHADEFMARPLVHHLVETPTEQFIDPVIAESGDTDADQAVALELEQLETPIPADSTQKRAVLWARQGRTFVLQGPPGTGKSQTITNMVAACVLQGQRVLFVAEKGTALQVVQRRLESIGLGPFTLNLHHEGSNATEVRAKLKSSLSATVAPDPSAMESARRRLRNARFELMRYPELLHNKNAAGMSAYSARDELIILGEGATVPISRTIVAHEPDKVAALRELFASLQQWTTSAKVGKNHPWRLAGPGNADPFDVAETSNAVRGVLAGTRWAETTSGVLRAVLDAVEHPRQIATLLAATNPVLPAGDELRQILEPGWPARAKQMLMECENSVAGWAQRLHGFPVEVVDLDLHAIAGGLQSANASGRFGRAKRQLAALAPLQPFSPGGSPLNPETTVGVLQDLISAQEAGRATRQSLAAIPGLGQELPNNVFSPGALTPIRARLDSLVNATEPLRSSDSWTQAVIALAANGSLAIHRDAIASWLQAWTDMWSCLAIAEDDYAAWRNERSLIAATSAVRETWQREADYERLLPLQHWCTLIRKLEPLRAAGLTDTRVALLEGELPAFVAEDAMARGIAQASLDERIATEGLDRFNAIAHDERVTEYAAAQAEMRKQWVTHAPSELLTSRGAGGLGLRTGSLARELEKTTRKLGTRAILRKHGAAVLELTPLVLASPASVVDLIEPGVMDFDVVIFDEASQITVPEAIGSLGRARAAIIVGDSKQMPPTRRVGGNSSEADIEDPDAEEIVEDQESILSESEIARVPTLSLDWHYRSQDEALIAFSNRAYYRGELSSFPTPTLLSSETGFEFHRIHWPEQDDRGMYLRAGSGTVDLGNGIKAGANTNRFEAQAIVAYVEEMVNSSDSLPSIGIVTFNEQQRQLIFDLLQASTDPRVATIMDEQKMGHDNVLFVKALEQVQGDERDSIVFSVAFSKQANGKIPTNFGPLSNSGGERRLNVAVTRARRKNVVFCSFDPVELDVDGSAYSGPKDLKRFLEFAKASGAFDDSGEEAVGTPMREVTRDRHRDDIAAALQAAGLHVTADVGLSDFRLDLLLARSDNPQQPLLPVLLDGEGWLKRRTVSDKDVLPIEVLEGFMGWPKVARIWWPMWLQNRESVIESILAEVDGAEVHFAEKAENAKPAVEDLLTADESRLDDAAPKHAEQVVETSAQAEAEADQPLATIAKPVEAERNVEDPVSASTAGGVAFAEVFARIVQQDDEGSEPGTESSNGSIDVYPFVAANTDVVGSRDMLDRLSEKQVALFVREQLLDVIRTEGPVEKTRLVRIVGRRFNLERVRAARVDEITRLIPRGVVRTSRKFGDFAWPHHLDPDTWTGYRTAGTGDVRPIEEIAPEEITNAMVAILRETPGLDARGEPLLRRTAEVFGIARMGSKVRWRLESVQATLPDVLPEDPFEVHEFGFAPESEDDGTASDDWEVDNELTVDDNPEPTGRGWGLSDLASQFADVIESGGTGFLSGNANSYIQWMGMPDQGLYLEVGDGRPAEYPLSDDFVEQMVPFGWRKPRVDIRNCWFQMPLAHGESESSYTTRLESMADMVLETLELLRSEPNDG